MLRVIIDPSNTRACQVCWPKMLSRRSDTRRTSITRMIWWTCAGRFVVPHLFGRWEVRHRERSLYRIPHCRRVSPYCIFLHIAWSDFFQHMKHRECDSIKTGGATAPPQVRWIQDIRCTNMNTMLRYNTPITTYPLLCWFVRSLSIARRRHSFYAEGH